LLKQGKPNAVAEVLDLFEAKQKEEKQPISDHLKVFRSVCRLMADRQVAKSWNWAIPSGFYPWAKKFSSYFREPDGGKVNVSSGHLEIYQKSTAQFGRSSPQHTADLWEHQVEWFLRLLSEQESGWYNSFLRSLQTDDRPVNPRWLQAGVSRETEAWRDVAEVNPAELSLRGVAGALLVSRLNENFSKANDLSSRLDQLVVQKNEKREKKKKKGNQKNRKKDSKGADLYDQIRALTEPEPLVSRWWREKGEVSFGWQATPGAESPGGFLRIVEIPGVQSILDRFHRALFTAFLKLRPDLVLRGGVFLEKAMSDPQYSRLGYGSLLDWTYETMASEVPRYRQQALESLVRWNRMQGNQVTADRWAQKLQEESSPQDPDSGISKKPSIPEDGKEAATRANRLYGENKYEEAAAAYQEILDRHPDSLYALSNLGVVRFQQKKYPQAEKALREAVRLAPQDAFSHAVLGVVLVQQEKYREALEILRRARQLDPKDAKTRNYLGISCSRLGLQQEAEEECRKAIELDENYGDAHFNLAVLCATRTPPDRETARQNYQKALKLGVPKDKELEKLLP
ncbi:MAG: tetratricopeptide repeat protein, partial [Verrucomicrobia bacterium]|nr:tetratricopeptide repeat protein [Verrucomicrobiota bacterium]